MAWVPVPERLMVCGLPFAVSDIVIMSVAAPAWVGWKLTWIEQFDPTGSTNGQLCVIGKAAVATVILMMLTVSVPVLVTVTVCAVDVVLMGWLEKDRFVVDNEMVGF